MRFFLLKLVLTLTRTSVEYHVVNGRHPTVEFGLWGAGRQFVPNTISLRDDAILNVITGPNMAGTMSVIDVIFA